MGMHDRSDYNCNTEWMKGQNLSVSWRAWQVSFYLCLGMIDRSDSYCDTALLRGQVLSVLRHASQVSFYVLYGMNDKSKSFCVRTCMMRGQIMFMLSHAWQSDTLCNTTCMTGQIQLLLLSTNAQYNRTIFHSSILLHKWNLYSIGTVHTYLPQYIRHIWHWL